MSAKGLWRWSQLCVWQSLEALIKKRRVMTILQTGVFIGIKSGKITEHESVNKSVLPTEPAGLYSYSLCCQGETISGLFWMEFNKKREGTKVKICVLSAFSFKRGWEFSYDLSCSRDVFPSRPTSNPLLGLTEEKPSLICEKPCWDIQLRTA